LVYPYSCTKHGEFDVVKHHSESSREEKCPKCGKQAQRLYVGAMFIGTAVQSAEFNPGLGQVVKSKYHRQEICKARDLVEVGNEKPATFKKHFEAQREAKRRKAYDEV
jgi:putative FmdB family regulatory protein